MAIRRSFTGMIGDIVVIRRQGNRNETWDDPREGQYEQGNAGAYTLRTLYDFWNASYRGLAPHGVLSGAPNSPDVVDNPRPFDETGDADFDTIQEDPDEVALPIDEIQAVPIVIMDDLSGIGRRTGAYFNAFTQAVTTSVDTLLTIDPYRDRAVITNAGPGIVYLGETESRGYGGYALPAASAPFLIPTTRAIYAIQQTGQVGPAQVSILSVTEKRELP